MTIVHLMAGLGTTSGVANVARRFARQQRDAGHRTEMLAPVCKWNPLYFTWAFAWQAWRLVHQADEVWVHCSWTFPVWFGAWLAVCYGKKLIVVPEASFDPMRMNNRADWKKRLVASLDRWVVRRADDVLALCPDEVAWIRAFEPQAKVRQAQVPLFVDYKRNTRVRSQGPLHVLFLGRMADPLKGVRFLTQAVEALNGAVILRLVSDHTGDELERDWAWCDVLCLPTLSDNFGLVIAEALEHGKGVITTDGASAWSAYDGDAFIYLRGYRAGTDERRVTLLTDALRRFQTMAAPDSVASETTPSRNCRSEGESSAPSSGPLASASDRIV